MSGVLEAVNLSVVFPGRRGRRPARAVDGVNLAVEPGEIVALIGESGCGKSTLSRALVGLIKPTGGSVRYGAGELSYGSRALKQYRRAVQLVLQDPCGALNPRQNVFDAVAEGPRLHRPCVVILTDPAARLALARGAASARAVRHALPARAVRRSAAARRHRRCARARAVRYWSPTNRSPSLDASVRGEILALILQLRRDLGLSAPRSSVTTSAWRGMSPTGSP